MDIAAWIKQNKLAAGGIAAGGIFLFLSTRGQASGPGALAGGTSEGQLVPVAAGYANEETALGEQTTEAAVSAAEAADLATQAAQDASQAAADAAAGLQEAVSTAVPEPVASPLAPDPPSPSTQTSNQQTFTQPPPVVVPSAYPLPGDYVAGRPFGLAPGDLGMLIGRVLGYKNVGSGSNSNGSYTTFRFFSDLGNTGDWNYYTSGAKKGQWAGPFNFPRHAPGG